ncbi:type II toxin-antitoxin system Phd/YefM family antitoxin [Arenimonas sp.]|uniref:type II toxin-antitoxin system Phd/YefM family antitoxin n=1 Tax=Arenimonas sp. TaxID=1872635 RepID=UPI0035B42D7C
MAEIINIHAAKTNFSQLVERAARGESVTIARAGKPLVRLVPVDAAAQTPRTGFLKGHGKVPSADTFNRMGSEELAALFEGDS